MKARSAACACLAFLLTACTTMLPHGATDAPRPFESYEQAEVAAGKIVPFQTREGELPRLGFDAREGSNVTLIPYPNIVARLAPYSALALEHLDPGIRSCILAMAGCKGYLFRFEREDRKREGSFMLDFFNIRRVTNVTGWWFEALVVVDANGVVLFRNVAGQPRLGRTDSQTNPLGPLQGAGEAAGAVLLH
ncbi:hypothetical protein H8N03_11075 [Ramlibacter sp. USB13]|uniref:Lipoprotein n=1 Tax=Ramlibacter cellulosilyticus TaxID=2764187 RepID=A0A923MTF6_9BURK|nr:hypothetical protein [Ramlibacter cellulosilyticus]MBC5783487.1 hypothetical protein [Ramlibacter cellulosilyticus]